jgi:arabinogalactan oligomer / maltooligosaccharide transport system substrate-binding protein
LRSGVWSLVGTVAVTLAALLLPGPALSTGKATPNLVIWTDAGRASAVRKVADMWASTNGATVKVVAKANLADIRDNLATVRGDTAPDVIVAAHDWTGQLAARRLVEPLYPSVSIEKQFPSNTLDAFSYGTAVKELYGIPVQVENIGLMVNTKLAKVPTTFAQLEGTALTWKKKHHLAFGICVQQGPGGDAYHMYPFFSGLGGYLFAVNSAGNIDPSNIGVANQAFLRNAGLIDKWNKEGLVNSKVTGSTCQDAFTKGLTPFWITGPWNDAVVEKARITFKVVQVPAIVKSSVPLLGVEGVMVTKYATLHNVDAAAKDLVVNYLSQASAQSALAAAGGRAPANLKAKASSPILAQFGAAAKGGVPIPNIPQMASVWGELGAAWVDSTKGAGAMPAARSFKRAAESIMRKIG